MASSSQADALARAAAILGRRRRRANPGERPLPDLWFLTDPARTPDPGAVLAALPPGSGVIYRHFGAADAAETAARLIEQGQRRRHVVLIGADARLAFQVGAAGVHLPERLLGVGPRLRMRHPGWLLTGAVHHLRALHAGQRAGLDGLLLSAAFESDSPSAGVALGPVRFSQMVRRSRLPVYALGGVAPATVRRLLDSGAAGVAAVSALA